MSDMVKEEIKTDSIIDGVSGFIVVDENGNPAYGSVISTRFKRIAAKYNQKLPSHKMEHFSPHILRHTFCTNMESAGLNIKSLQYKVATIYYGACASQYDTQYLHPFECEDGSKTFRRNSGKCS